MAQAGVVVKTGRKWSAQAANLISCLVIVHWMALWPSSNQAVRAPGKMQDTANCSLKTQPALTASVKSSKTSWAPAQENVQVLHLPARRCTGAGGKTSVYGGFQLMTLQLPKLAPEEVRQHLTYEVISLLFGGTKCCLYQHRTATWYLHVIVFGYGQFYLLFSRHWPAHLNCTSSFLYIYF